LSVAEPRRITRINTDAGDGVAFPLLPRLTTAFVFRRALCLQPAQIRPMGIGRSRLHLCVNASVIAGMIAVRISARFVMAGYYHKDG
jgi:hypothetical protein